MYAIAIGRVLRMLRIRRNLRQSDVAAKARISKSVVGRHENGRIGSIGALERHGGVFGLRIDVRLAGRAGQLTRLADEEHARIVEMVAGWFRAAGFLIETEASFSEWGERGRVDLLAFDPSSGTLVIVEVKTQFLDLQDLFGSINVKERLAAAVAERRGWNIRRRVTLIAAADTGANRKIVREHSSLFAPFAPRRLTLAAVRGGPDRLLNWVRADGNARTSWLAGRQRVRRRRTAYQGYLPRREPHARQAGPRDHTRRSIPIQGRIERQSAWWRTLVTPSWELMLARRCPRPFPAR